MKATQVPWTCPGCGAEWTVRPVFRCASCVHREAVAEEVGCLPEEAYLTWSAFRAARAYAVEDGDVALRQEDDGSFEVVDLESEE